MSDISHSDYCPYDQGGEEECQFCADDRKADQAYYAALFRNSYRMSREEIEGVYQDSPGKRDAMLRAEGY